MQKYQDIVQDSNGNAIQGCTIAVYNHGTGALATIYSDNALTVSANPVTTDANGNFYFYADNGRYNLVATYAGVVINKTDVLIEDTNQTTPTYGASFVAFSPTGTIAAANVQDAIAEVASEALQKSSNLSDLANVATARSNLGLTAAGGAALIGYTPTGTVAAGTVQTAIDEVVSDLAASSGSSLVGFIQSGTGAVATTVQSELRNYVNVKQFGAVGNGIADDTSAIQAAINAVSTGSVPGTVVFPSGTYKTTSTITITADGVSLVGENRWAGGPQIVGSTSGMGDVILVNKPAAGTYGFQMRGLHVSAANGLASPPNGIHTKDCSELNINDCTIGPYLSDGIRLNGSTICYIDNNHYTTNAVGVRVTVSGTSLFATCNSISITHSNIWQSSSASILIDGSVDAMTVRDTWMEYAPIGIYVSQPAATNVVCYGLTFDNVYFANGNTSPYGNARFFKALGQATALYYFSLQHTKFINCKSNTFQTVANAYHIELLLNGNTHAVSSFNWSEVDGGVYWGASTATINTDVTFPNSPSMLLGNIESLDRASANIPVTSGTGSWATIGLNQSTRSITFTGSQSAASATPDFLFNTPVTRSGGGYVFRLTNNGTHLFGVTTGGAGNVNSINITDGTTIFGAITTGGGVQPGQLNSGGTVSSSVIYSGSGVPNNLYGINGDFYFRSDTPGTANQRLYVKSAGAWVGIL